MFYTEDNVRALKILTLGGKNSGHKAGYSIFGILKTNIKIGSKMKIWNDTMGNDLETSTITKTTTTEDGRLLVETEDSLFLIELHTPSFKR